MNTLRRSLIAAAPLAIVALTTLSSATGCAVDAGVKAKTIDTSKTDTTKTTDTKTTSTTTTDTTTKKTK